MLLSILLLRFFFVHISTSLSPCGLKNKQRIKQTHNKKGGGTVWPCRAELPPSKESNSSKNKFNGSLSEACKSAFDKGARWFDGKDTTVKGQMRKVCESSLIVPLYK
jgi:hypothetical protein